MKSLSIKVGVFLVVIGFTTFVYAEVWGATEFERTTLRGLKELYVVVERVNPDVEKDGLSRNQLLTDVELQLRKAGIGVQTKEESLKTPSVPTLYVNVNATKDKSKSYCCSISVSLLQVVLLERDPSIRTSAKTWGNGVVGGGGESVIKSHIRDGLRDLIDEFINDYLAVNPKRD